MRARFLASLAEKLEAYRRWPKPNPRRRLISRRRRSTSGQAFAPPRGAHAAWRRARPCRLLNVARRDHARALRRRAALSLRRTEMAGARPHDPEQGSRLHRPICHARREGFHSLRDARHVLPPRFHSRRPSEAAKIPGVEASTGALGHGLSYGVGMALAARIEKRDTRVIVVMGDGEINEGSVWEAALCAGKHKLKNLTAVIDYNKIQSAGPTREIQDLEPLLDKWRLQFRRGRRRRPRRRGLTQSLPSPAARLRSAERHHLSYCQGQGHRVRRERR